MPDEAGRRLEHSHLSALLKVSLALSGTLDLREVLQEAVEGAVEVLELDSGAIYLLDGPYLVLGATTPALPAHVPNEARRAELANHPRIKQAIDGAQPVLISDVTHVRMSPQEKEVVSARGLRSLLYVPLMMGDHPEGVMIVGTANVARTYTDEDVDLCRTLSAQITLAITNARLFESAQLAAAELRCAYDATLEGWSLALELRDEETSGHTERAAALAVELAELLGIPESQLSHVRRGALLHDIGKMAVPDSILRKPGSLTEEEWAVMRRHPEYARTFLSQIEYLEPALDIPYSHHERWNGSGYPQGLKGEDIPLPARIFAVIDVFDALTSDRPYRKAWT
ncbi:HD domain-containing protein, partial [bacterium]|nr:HD domain-containing protein [bacterium]